MKTSLTLLLACLLYVGARAQNTGIAVQGIARDADKSAIVNETMTFTFEIQAVSNSQSYYKEDVTIKTDAYGVFSHIVGTGNMLAGSGEFLDIPFYQEPMKLIITVNYKGTPIVVSNAPLQSTPYALSAANGVPTGTIVAFAGDESNIPAGWVLCDGRDISGLAGSLNLRNLLGSNNVPDLRGMFLRGTGTSPVNGQPGPALRATQDDGFESHLHDSGSITANTAGSHVHTITIKLENAGSGDDSGDNSDNRFVRHSGGDNAITITSTASGNHSHTTSGSTGLTGIAETRPVNYGINYIIKL